MGRALSRDLRDRVVAAIERRAIVPTGGEAVQGQRCKCDPLAATELAHGTPVGKVRGGFAACGYGAN
jgi:hypothetical protein